MVGEIRDNETASLAVNAALTSNLVLSTLHTNSMPGGAQTSRHGCGAVFDGIHGQCRCRPKTGQNALLRQRKILFKQPAVGKIVQRSGFGQSGFFLVKEKIMEKVSDWSKVPFYKPALNKECPEGYKE